MFQPLAALTHPARRVPKATPSLPRIGAATDTVFRRDLSPNGRISDLRRRGETGGETPGIQLTLTPNRSRQEFRMRFGLPEMLVILFIVLLIFGANRLPGLAKGVGQSIKNFKDAVKEGDEKKP